MKRARVAGACVLALAFNVACGRTDLQSRQAKAPAHQIGCLTALGNQFVLTDLERGEGTTATEAFQLIGDAGLLRRYVGQQVRVAGEAEAARVAVVDESTPPPQPREPTGTSGTGQPAVSTETQTRLEVRKLRVATIEPTGSSCTAETERQ